MTLVPSAADSAAHQLAGIAHDLARLIDRITDAAARARGLADAVHWQAKAATAFHDRTTRWAGDVSGLRCVAETARLEVARARDRAAFADSFTRLFAGASR
ncbi:hypothetical protein [Microbacterium sp. E-13]|uniref:hypothetical protein n=1 Tax=Microbacterium sp. E-13 TaxID=3404048 RepID=UPI003CF6980D